MFRICAVLAVPLAFLLLASTAGAGRRRAAPDGGLRGFEALPAGSALVPVTLLPDGGMAERLPDGGAGAPATGLGHGSRRR